MLTQFARTGDPKYFYAGHVAGRHTSEVDTIHFVNDDLKNYFESNFGKGDYPVRAGTHNNTAFALILAAEYARVAGNSDLLRVLSGRARTATRTAGRCGRRSSVR